MALRTHSPWTMLRLRNSPEKRSSRAKPRSFSRVSPLDLSVVALDLSVVALDLSVVDMSSAPASIARSRPSMTAAKGTWNSVTGARATRAAPASDTTATGVGWLGRLRALMLRIGVHHVFVTAQGAHHLGDGESERTASDPGGGRVHMGTSSSFVDGGNGFGAPQRSVARGEDRSDGRVRRDQAHANHPSLLTDMLEGVSAEL